MVAYLAILRGKAMKTIVYQVTEHLQQEYPFLYSECSRVVQSTIQAYHEQLAERGWKIVPTEPTPEMLAEYAKGDEWLKGAGMRAAILDARDGDRGDPHHKVMLQAAPKVPE